MSRCEDCRWWDSSVSGKTRRWHTTESGRAALATAEDRAPAGEG